MFVLLEPKPPKVPPVLVLVWPKPPLPKPLPKDMLKAVEVGMGSCTDATDDGLSTCTKPWDHARQRVSRARLRRVEVCAAMEDLTESRQHKFQNVSRQVARVGNAIVVKGWPRGRNGAGWLEGGWRFFSCCRRTLENASQHKRRRKTMFSLQDERTKGECENRCKLTEWPCERHPRGWLVACVCGWVWTGTLGQQFELSVVER